MKEKEQLYKKLYLKSDEFLEYSFHKYEVPNTRTNKEDKIAEFVNNKFKNKEIINNLDHIVEEERRKELIKYLKTQSKDNIIIKNITQQINNNTVISK